MPKTDKRLLKVRPNQQVLQLEQGLGIQVDEPRLVEDQVFYTKGSIESTHYDRGFSKLAQNNLLRFSVVVLLVYVFLG
jgi:hypothetical protein